MAQATCTTQERCCHIIPLYFLKALAKSSNDNIPSETRQACANAINLVSETVQTYKANLGTASSNSLVASSATGKTQLYDALHGQRLPGKFLFNESNIPSSGVDKAAGEAFANLQIVRDAYLQLFKRKSIDDHDMPMLASVHYLEDYPNASWQPNEQQMVFGDGDHTRLYNFTASLDVIAHEVTHGVTEKTARLQYEGQSGALNESMSDVMGAVIEQWHLKQSASQAKWLIGEGVLWPTVAGIALRSMKAPGTAFNDTNVGWKDDQVSHMNQYQDEKPYTENNDYGWVHKYSGIPNHAFYLLAISLGGNSWDQAGPIWYQSLLAITDEYCNFTTFAKLTVQKATQMYGSQVGTKVSAAWAQVGIQAGAN